MSNKIQKKQYRIKLRQDMFNLYGLSCVCCGETQYEFLTINHKDGKGAEHRKQMFGISRAPGGSSFYAKILKLPTKDLNLETMCFNCNTADHIFGICPHRATKNLDSQATA